MPIVKLNEFKYRQAGIYIICPEDPTLQEKNGYKIGRTIQMDKRLNSYHICFNGGMWICKALMLNDLYKTRKNDDKKATLAKTIEVEKYIHKLLDKYNHTTSTRRKSEWYICTDEVLNKALIETHKRFDRDTDYPIVGFKKPFYNKFYIDNIEDIITSKITPKSMPQDGQKTRSGRVIKSTKDTKFKDMVYIVDKKEKKKPMIKLNMKPKQK